MIFCSVGNDHHRFKRFEKVVRILSKENNIIFQHGYSNPIASKAVENIKFLSEKTFELNLKNAEQVIVHSGAGTLLLCSELKIIPAVFIREKRYKEHIDDHQKEIFDAFFELGLVKKLELKNEEVIITENRNKSLITKEKQHFVKILTNKIRAYLS